ncbi:MAG: autotransporter outer membrane beta-barrel domain-containing protein, partial [Kluyvera sp.]
MMPIPLKPRKLALCITVALLAANISATAVYADTLNANNTLYYYSSGNTNGNNSDYTNYDEVVITTNAIASTSGLKGWAIYMNGENYKFNDLTVNTAGMLSDGIHTKNGGGNIVIENYKATTSAYSSDGINLGRELSANYSRVTVNNETNIKAAGMGVRANA